jgi:hypothetical protein
MPLYHYFGLNPAPYHAVLLAILFVYDIPRVSDGRAVARRGLGRRAGRAARGISRGAAQPDIQHRVLLRRSSGRWTPSRPSHSAVVFVNDPFGSLDIKHVAHLWLNDRTLNISSTGRTPFR